jgi:predicted CDP-diglyceride synthetase/phosphatidate cytidylyltransferase
MSIGAIDFGLFLFVYCLGHFAYLLRFSTGLLMLMVLAVAICDLADRVPRLRGGDHLARCALRYLATAPLVLALVLPSAPRLGLSAGQAWFMILTLPALVIMGNFSLRAIELDLGIEPAHAGPGRGRLFDALKSHLFVSPLYFHWLRYATDIL